MEFTKFLLISLIFFVSLVLISIFEIWLQDVITMFPPCRWPKDGKRSRIRKLSLSAHGYNREECLKATEDNRRHHPVIL